MKQTSFALVTASLLLMSACAGSGTQTSAPPAASATAAPATTENVPEVITGLENEWVKAIVSKDAATIDRLIADDFIGTTNDVQYGKTDAIEDVKTGTHESLDLSNITVHVYGPDTAVATMDQNEKSKHGTEDFSGHYLFTDVWVKRDGQWRAVASHGSRAR
jgi:ketosteroid isomerase-like protein